MAIIGGDQGKAGESKGSGRKADDLRLSCLCLLLMLAQKKYNWLSMTKIESKSKEIQFTFEQVPTYI